MSFSAFELQYWNVAERDKVLLTGSLIDANKKKGLVGCGTVELIAVKNQLVLRFRGLNVPNLFNHDLAVFWSAGDAKGGRIPPKSPVHRLPLDRGLNGLLRGSLEDPASGEAADEESSPHAQRRSKRLRRRRSMAAGDWGEEQEADAARSQPGGAAKGHAERQQDRDMQRDIRPAMTSQSRDLFEIKLVSGGDVEHMRSVLIAKPPDAEPQGQYAVHCWARMGEYRRPKRSIAGARVAREHAERVYQAALRVQSREAAFEQIRRHSRQVFQELDADQSGTIDFDEFLGMLEYLNVFMLQPQARRVFQICDGDESGELDQSEFELALYINAKADIARRPPLLEDAYGVFDEDLNQRLDVVEFQECLRFLGLNVPDDTSEKVFKRVAAAGAKEDKREEEKKKRKKKKSKKEREREKKMTKEEKERAKLLSTNLNLKQFKRAWAECSDVVAELRKRAEEPRPQEGTAAAANREANIQRLIELTDHDYNEMLEMLREARREGTMVRRRIRLQREEDRRRVKKAQEQENAKQVKEQVKAVTAEKQTKAELKRQEEVELALEQRLEREVAERSGNVEEARRQQLRKAREGQIKERAQAGWGSMDLSHGNMTVVPSELYTGKEAWTRWAFLVTLDLSNNLLTALPERGMLYPLSSLERLDLSRNHLTHLPDEVRELSSLRVLLLQDNSMRTFPDALGFCRDLVKLDARNNELEELPETMTNMGGALRLLNLANNKLTALPGALCDLAALKFLDLSLNDLETLPSDFGSLTSLTRLDLSWNRLEDFPESMGGLHSLLSLNAAHNTIQVLPSSFGGMTSLQTLQLPHNNLGTVPSSVADMRHLSFLDISHNDLRMLPRGAGALPTMTHLDLSSNRLHSIPSTVGLMTSLRSCDLSANAIAELPVEVGALRRLESLSLAHNAIRELPDEFGYMTGLTSLWVSHNQLEALPPRLSQLVCLRELDASHNRLRALTRGVRTLVHLERLMLGVNAMTEVPPAVGSLASLTELDLSANRLEALPATMGNLSRLRRLNLYNNRLRGLPPALGALFTSLESLDVARNPMADLPKQWSKDWSLTDQYRTRTTGGYTEQEVSNWVALQSVSYDTMCRLWRQRQGGGSTTGPTSLRQFTEDVQVALGLQWHGSLAPIVQDFYFRARRDGVLPRYDALSAGEKKLRESQAQAHAERKEEALAVVREEQRRIADRERAMYHVDADEIVAVAREREEAVQEQAAAQRAMENAKLRAQARGRQLELDLAREERKRREVVDKTNALREAVIQREREVRERERRRADPVLAMTEMMDVIRSKLRNGRVKGASQGLDRLLLHIREHLHTSAMPMDAVVDASRQLLRVLGELVESPPERGSFKETRERMAAEAAEPVGLVSSALAQLGASGRAGGRRRPMVRADSVRVEVVDESEEDSADGAMPGPPSRSASPRRGKPKRDPARAPAVEERPTTPTSELGAGLLGRAAQAFSRMEVWNAALDLYRYLHSVRPHDTRLAEEFIRVLDSLSQGESQEKLTVMLRTASATQSKPEKEAFLRAAASIIKAGRAEGAWGGD